MQANKKKINPILLIISPLVLLLFFIIYTTLNKGSIQGKIVDSSDGNILTGVQIILDNKKEILNNNLTGGFTISKVNSGDHNIKVIRSGYTPYEEKISLKFGQDLNLNISLVKENVITNSETNISIACTTLNENSLSIINTIGNNNIIEVGERPSNIVFSESKRKLYTQSISGGFISVIDTNTVSKVKDIKFDNKYQIKRLAVSPSGDKLYAYVIEAGKIFIIDSSSDNIVSSINLQPITVDFSIDNITANIYVIRTEGIDIYSPSGGLISSYKFKKTDFYSEIVIVNNKAFLSHSTNNSLLFVDLVTGNESIINTNGRIKDILNDSQNIYVLSDSSIESIQVNNTENIKKIDLNNTDHSVMALSKDKSRIYIADKSEILKIFDIATQNLSDKTIKAKSDIREFIEF